MLRDDDIMTIGDDERYDDESRVRSGVITTPNAFQDGVMDVISMKALVRAVTGLRKTHAEDEEFERALVKIINLNGAMARKIQNGKR